MITGVFQTWMNDSLQLSGLYLTSTDGQEAVDRFIENSKSSHATLHTFEDEQEAKEEHSKFSDIL